MMQVKEQHKSNELMLHLLEQQLIANQHLREAQVGAVNNELYRRETLRDSLAFLSNTEIPQR